MVYGTQYSLLKNFSSLEDQQLFEQRLVEFCKGEDAAALLVMLQEDGTMKLAELRPEPPLLRAPRSDADLRVI